MATSSSASSAASKDATDNPPKRRPLAKLVGPAIHPALTEVTYEFQTDTIHLFGEVPTFYLKQVAQETANRLSETRRVLNHIQVAPRDWH